jgi:LmbE family N-acetylglucosaminyl deacetylase
VLEFPVGGPRRPLKKILCLGAHCDDIEIGCGATILELIAGYRHLEFYWVVFSSDPVREGEARRAAARFLRGARQSTVVIRNFRNGYFPHLGREIKDYFEELKKRFSPDLIFTHCRHDLHQDHRTLSELTWNTFRDHAILEYEIVKYDGDLRTPNVYVPVRERSGRRKISILQSAFRSQSDKPWFTEDTFLAILRLRGVECASRSNLAEAYYGRKISLSTEAPGRRAGRPSR